MSSGHVTPPERGPLRFHHVGLACRDIEATRQFVRATQRVVHETPIIHDPLQDADLCMLTDDSGARLELVAGPVVASWLKRGTSFYHLCYETPDLAGSIEDLEQHGSKLIREPRPAVLFDLRNVCFVMTPMGLVELLELE